MSEAPERIWITAAFVSGGVPQWDDGGFWQMWPEDCAEDMFPTQYVRADHIEAQDALLREAWSNAYMSGYLDGFNASGEGWNGESFEGCPPQHDFGWAELRQVARDAFLAKLEPKP